MNTRKDAKSRLGQLKVAKRHLLRAEAALSPVNWTSWTQQKIHDVILLVQENIEQEEKQAEETQKKASKP